MGGHSALELRVDEVTKRFGETTAVEHVSFEVERGGFVTLLGPSGSGKTTLLRCIAGVETPDSGTIEIGGRVVFSKERGLVVPPEQRGVGMVYQSYALWPHMTVFDNIAYPLKVRGAKVGIDERVDKVLKMLNMGSMKRRYPHQLSGGEQQRVAFARALVYDPEVLLLDEPFSNLDTPLRERLRDELKMVQHETGITTIYVTHHRIEASSMSDKIVILTGGRVSAIGTPSDLLERPPNPYVASFLAGRLILNGVAHILSDGTTVVQTSAGQLQLSPGNSVSEGKSVWVYVKPSLTRLVRDKRGRNLLGGEVTGITREADFLEYHVAVEEQIIKVPHDVKSDWKPELKERVFVEAPPAASTLA